MSEAPPAAHHVFPATVAKLLAKDAKLHAVLRIVAAFRALNAELPMQQAAVLLTIATKPGVTASEVEALLRMSQASVSRSVHALSALHPRGVPGLGLVEQQPDPHDSRRACLHLTKKGLEFIRHLLLTGLAGGDQAGDWPGPVYAATRRLRGLPKGLE